MVTVMFRIAERSQKLIHDFLERNKNLILDYPIFDPAHISEAFTELTNRILNDPNVLLMRKSPFGKAI